MEYPWKRFWSPRTGHIALDPPGFLLDPEQSYGNVLNPDVKTYSQIESTRCLVLLGEPGIGKSTAIAHIARATPGTVRFIDLKNYGSEDRLIKELFESVWWKTWLADDSQLILFLDSLDEGLMRVPHLARAIGAGFPSAAD